MLMIENTGFNEAAASNAAEMLRAAVRSQPASSLQ